MLLAVAAHLPSVNNDYVEWDDAAYIRDNPLLRSPAGLTRIWTSFDAPQYYPVTFTSYWLEYRIWGQWPDGYRGVNILLHALNSLLVLRLARLVGLSAAGAAIAAGLFAVHPANTASVVWLAERKNLLSLCFALLTAFAYLRFARLGAIAWLVVACGLFALALLSKTAVAPLPLLLAPLAVWRLGACPKRAWIGALPLFALAVAAGAITVLREVETGTVPLPLAQRPLVAAAAAWFYLGKLLLPIDLSPLYGRWNVSILWPAGWTALAAWMAVIAAVLRFSPRLPKVLLWSGAWFLLFLAPALHLIPFDFAAHAFVADHLVYSASAGAFLIAGWAIAPMFDDSRLVVRRAGAIGTTTVAAMLIAASWEYGTRWHSPVRFWEPIARRTPQSASAQYGYGTALLRRGRPRDAIVALDAAVKLRPAYVEAWDALGVACDRLGEAGRSIAACRNALRLREDYGPAHLHLGEFLAKQGQIAAAWPHAQRALALLPMSADAEHLAGLLADARGDLSAAILHNERAVAFAPDHAAARTNLGGALARLQRFEEAERHLRAALARDPSLLPAWTNLGHVQLSLQRPQEALSSFQSALSLAPQDLVALRGLAEASIAAGRGATVLPALTTARERFRAAGDETTASLVQRLIDRIAAAAPQTGISP